MPIKRYDPKRNESRALSGGPAGLTGATHPILTALICVACIVVTAGYLLTGENGPAWGALPAPAIWDGRYGALVTATFVHGDLLHIVFNVGALMRFGSAVERALGHLEFAVFCLLAALVASGTELFAFGSTGIGASGVAYALFGLCWGARRSVPLLAQVADDDTVRFGLGWLVLCIVLTSVGAFSIANGAHVGGLLFGLAVAWLLDRPATVKKRAAGGALFALLAAVTVLAVTYLPWNPLWRVWNASRPPQPTVSAPLPLTWF